MSKSDDEDLRRNRRRRQNREAAQRCRQKKREFSAKLLKEYQGLQSTNTQLLHEVRTLYRQKQSLNECLQEHVGSCPKNYAKQSTAATAAGGLLHKSSSSDICRSIEKSRDFRRSVAAGVQFLSVADDAVRAGGGVTGDDDDGKAGTTSVSFSGVSVPTGERDSNRRAYFFDRRSARWRHDGASSSSRNNSSSSGAAAAAAAAPWSRARPPPVAEIWGEDPGAAWDSDASSKSLDPWLL